MGRNLIGTLETCFELTDASTMNRQTVVNFARFAYSIKVWFISNFEWLSNITLASSVIESESIEICRNWLICDRAD